MADTARKITAESLHARLPVENPHDEFGRLAGVFNETLCATSDPARPSELRRSWSDGTSTASTPSGGGLAASAATIPAAGVGRRDRPADGQQRPDHVSNASGQITCQRQLQ